MKDHGAFEYLLSTGLYPYPFAWNLTTLTTAVALNVNTAGAQVLARAHERNGTEDFVAFASFSPNGTRGRLFYIGTDLSSESLNNNRVSLRGCMGWAAYFHSYILDEVYMSKTRRPLRENWVGIDTPLPIGFIIDDFTGQGDEEKNLNYASALVQQEGLKLSLAAEMHEWTGKFISSELTKAVLSRRETFELINHLWDHNSTYHSTEAIEANFANSQEAFIRNANLLGQNVDGWKYVVHPGEADNETIVRVAQQYGIAAIISYRELEPFGPLCEANGWCLVPYNKTGWVPYRNLERMGVLQVPRYTYPMNVTDSSRTVATLMLYIREAIAYNMPLIFGTHPRDWSNGSSMVSDLLGVVQAVKRSSMGADFKFVSHIVEPHVVTYKTDEGWVYVHCLGRDSEIIWSESLADRMELTILSSETVSTTLRVISPSGPREVVGALSWEYDKEDITWTIVLRGSVSNITIYFPQNNAASVAEMPFGAVVCAIVVLISRRIVERVTNTRRIGGVEHLRGRLGQE